MNEHGYDTISERGNALLYIIDSRIAVARSFCEAGRGDVATDKIEAAQKAAELYMYLIENDIPVWNPEEDGALPGEKEET